MTNIMIQTSALKGSVEGERERERERETHVSGERERERERVRERETHVSRERERERETDSPRNADGDTVPLLRDTMTLMPVSMKGTEKSMTSDLSSLMVSEPTAM